MKMKTTLAILASTFAVGLALAQPPDAAEFQRASTTHRLADFPKVHKDGRVWFQFKAPKAQKVELTIGNANPKTYDMERLADGTWNLVVPNPGPGPQLYTMIVDGVTVMDPGSETFYSNGVKAEVEVPSPGEDFYDMKGRAARSRAPAPVLFQSHGGVAAHVHLPAAGLRCKPAPALPGPLFATRRRRGRNRMDARRPRAVHPRQPARRKESRSHDRRDEQRLRQRQPGGAPGDHAGYDGQPLRRIRGDC